MSEYVDTEILECSRASSEQVKEGDFRLGDPKSIFTNKLGQAVVLEVGDKVSVERSFLNGLGSGNPQTIQFKGRHIPQKVNKTITYTDVILDYLQDDPDVVPYRLGHYLKYEYGTITEEIKDLRDNIQDLVIGYYINNNNHNSYLQLPRRFACIAGEGGTPPAGVMGPIYTRRDGFDNGFPVFTIQPSNYVRSDWVLRKGYIGLALKKEYDIYRQRVNNDRFALYVRDKAYYDEDIDGSENYLPDTTDNRHYPMFKPYTRYLEKKTLNIKKGFNTPSSVSNQLTQQLNQTEPPDKFYINEGLVGTPQIQLTQTIEGTTYKPFNSASFHEMRPHNYNEYISDGANHNTDALTYFNSFLFMGVKRPEIFETGRLIPQMEISGDLDPAPDGMRLMNNIPLADHTDEDINHAINLKYTQANLLLIRDMFDAQKLYPELWDRIEDLADYKEFSGRPLDTNTRFLHLNYYGDIVGNAPAGVIQPYLGNDGMDAKADGDLTGFTNKASGAWFIHWDDEYHDVYYPPDLIPPEVFVFGFAKSYSHGGEWYIAIRIPQGIDVGIPTNFFTEKEGGAGDLMIHADRRIGYDWNATAFGSCFIVPYSGYSPESYEGNVPIDSHSAMGIHPTWRRDIDDFAGGQKSIMPFATQSYIGADNPLIDYDGTTNRFIISQFHTAENVGDEYNAGDPVGVVLVTPPLGVPTNPDASSIVYKINPRVTPWGYSPTFNPYVSATQISYTYPNAILNAQDLKKNERSIELPNENIESYSIFDSHGGIYIYDAGVHKEEWSDSWWGILGFNYDQMNAELTEYNTLKMRIDISNKFNLRYPTTNAEVDVSNTKSYIANEYGAVLYTSQIPLPMTLQNYKIAGGPAVALDSALTIYPFISQLTQSISLSAKDLSKQMLNPFYTIRSDIISTSKYIGGLDSGMKMPIVAVVDRYGAEGDYYFGSPSDLSFTITKQCSIGDITTSIHDPDGSYALLDNNSGVIYKIQRNRVLPQNVLEEIMKDEKNNKKK